MHRHIAALATLPFVLVACAGEAPVAQSPSTTSAPPTTSATTTTTTTTTTPTTTSSTNTRPPAPPSANPGDCFDADCTLLLTGPATVPLDAAKFHYPAMRVTAIDTTSLTYSVTYPQGGGAQSTVGVGLGSGSFGFRGFPSVEVGLTLVGGKPALVLQPGTVS